MIFKKRSYSDREIQEILDSLFIEKKKVAALELQLKNCTLAPAAPLSDELETLKVSYENALQKNLSLETGLSKLQQEQLIESREKTSLLTMKEEQIKQLENELSTLYKQLEDTKTSHQAPQEGEKQKSLYEALHKSNEENSLSKEALHQAEEKLQRTVEEAEFLKEQLEATKRDKEDLEAEDHALKEQFEALKTQFIHLQSTHQTNDLKRQEYELLSEERGIALQNTLKELELFKQMMMKNHEAMQEEKLKLEENYIKQIANLKGAAITEKSNTLEQELAMKAVQSDLERTKELFNQSQEALIHATEQLKAHEVAERELEIFSKELKNRKERAEESEQILQEKVKLQDEELLSLKAALEDALLKIRQAEADRNEKESEFRVAQQHLAKKMREAATISEKVEEQKLKIAELEKAFETMKEKTYELQAQLDAEQIHRQRNQQQAEEALKAAQQLSTKWEEKYSQVKERLEESESKNRELKKLEERFGKLYAAFSQISQIMISPSQPVGEEITPFQNPKNEMTSAEQFMVPQPIEIAYEEPSLFNQIQQKPKFKESLFG